MSDLTAAIDARIPSGVSGGVEQVLIGLASAFANLGDGDEKYLFLSEPDHREWLIPHVGGRVSLLDPAAKRGVRRAVRRIAGARAVSGRLPRRRALPLSDGAIEREGVHVMHFTLQFSGFRTAIPSIYQPHDLQHMHFPEFFTKSQVRDRDRNTRAWTRQATKIAVMSSWGRDDVIAMLGTPSERICVVPWAPVIDFYPTPTDEDLFAVQRRWGLPDRFILYPAQTWRHKNHLRLIEALALLKGRMHEEPTLVCTGGENEFYPTLVEAATEAGVAGQVRFLGFVSPLEIRSLYRLATALLFPSLFEGWGMPVLEAFRERLPVACSTSCMLPALVGDAALLFDPGDTEAVATAILRLMDDQALRDRLCTRGYERAAEFTWERTARLLRANYRQVAGQELSTIDVGLLVAEPTV